MDFHKFPENYLQLFFDTGNISRDLSTLYSQRKTGKEQKYVVDFGLQNIDDVIKYQEERLEKSLLRIKEIMKHGS